MLIEDVKGRKGTGFAIRRMREGPVGKTILITNKHVLRKEGHYPTSIRLHLNVLQDGKVQGHSLDFILRNPEGKIGLREHPDSLVDVAAIDISAVLNRIPLAIRLADYSMFADRSVIETGSISIGDEVFVIGYPLGLRYKSNNLPLMRRGIISTLVGESIELGDKPGALRGFLIDGGTSPGSSGSPVVYSGPLVIDNAEGIELRYNTIPYLMGIVSEARLARIETNAMDYLSYSGLSTVYDTETIRETVELFFDP